MTRRAQLRSHQFVWRLANPQSSLRPQDGDRKAGKNGYDKNLEWQTSPFGERIGRRFESFTSLGEDKSLAAREASSAVVLGWILDEPMGRGLGATGSAKRLATGGTATFDSGLLNIFFSLGWVGGLLYLGGTLVLLLGLLRRFEPRNDPIPKVARAVGFATFAALASLNTLVGASGVIFWGFIGLSISARGWYHATDRPARAGYADPEAIVRAPGYAHARR